MKASEILKRYANGERNFRNVDLRGQNLRFKDLSGADFSGADIRSTNFANSNLRQTNFSGAKAGEQSWWIVHKMVFTAALVCIVFYHTGAEGFISIISVVMMFLIIHFVYQNSNYGDEKSNLLHNLKTIWNSMGGTSFYQADLTGANFSNAYLKGAVFNKAKLAQVFWQNAKHLDCSRVGDSILRSSVVRELLVTRNGYKKQYTGLDLHSANLSGVNLNEASLRFANLAGTNFQHANLQRTDLSGVFAPGADFAGASLTGACIKAWRIDHTTNLEGADCQYVYLLEHQQERRPNSGSFQPGEFPKLFEELLDTIDLIFQNGIDWKAFVKAFDKVRVDNNGTELTIQSIENKGDGVIVVRVDVPPDTNKEKIHSEFKQTYEEIRKQLEAQYKQQLNAKDREIEIYEEQSVQMWSVINRLAERPPVSTIENILGNKVVHDQSQTFQGNVNINAENSVVNLRDISGQVSNQINQLPTEFTPDQPNLKDLLTRLQNAVETDSELDEEGKVEALVEVGELANAAQNPKESTIQKTAKGAMNALKGIAASLSDASKLASACKELMPLIMTAFGFP